MTKDSAIKDTVKQNLAKVETAYLDGMKQAVIDALEDIKGFDIAVMDVRKLTNITNYMIVASATSSRQAKAMGDNVREKMKEKGYNIRGTEGENLEQLWGDAEARRGHIKPE